MGGDLSEIHIFPEIEADSIVIGTGYVPVIDLSAARSGDPHLRKLTAEFIDKTCRESGFLVIIGHGIPEHIINKMYQAVRTFFSQSESDKELVYQNPNDLFTRGYHRGGSLDASNANVDIIAAHQIPDLTERYVYNPMGEPGAESRISWPESGASNSLLWLPNKWPDIPGFKEIFQEYFQYLQILAIDLMHLFALGLNLPETWFDDKISEEAAVLIANHYPPQRITPLPGQVRLGRHSDWGSLTILFQDDNVNGLQILDKEGNWVDVPAVPGSFIVNIGDLMAMWTNDAWVSTVHRVRNPPPDQAHIERISIPFFHQPNHDAVIECIPGCANAENPPKYQPVVSGEYLLEKYVRAYN